MKPNDVLTFNLIYYKFLLDDKDQSFGLVPARVNHALADEVDLIARRGAHQLVVDHRDLLGGESELRLSQAVDGSATWVNGYLYMNFNF